MSEVVKGLGLIIASTGRPEVLRESMESIASMETVPEEIILVGAGKGDLPEVDCGTSSIRREIASRRSSTSQRIHGIRSLGKEIKYVSILDDDCEVHQQYFAEVRAVFESYP